MKPTLKPEQELENIKIENASLREKILEKTLELENKSRQLEIEAALEKVRAITMKMRKSDDLQRAAFGANNQIDAARIALHALLKLRGHQHQQRNRGDPDCE